MCDTSNAFIYYYKNSTSANQSNLYRFSRRTAIGSMKLGTAGSVTMTNMNAYPLTASPTLTNPDMILPYSDEETSVSTSSWKNNRNGFGYDTNDNNFSPAASLITPRTPIFYGTGTILSDIGEVTEAEGTSIGQKNEFIEKKISRHPQYNSPVRSSPKNTHEAFRERAKVESHRRHLSNQSMSTVASDETCTHVFKHIEENLTFDDISFQGDDEESALDTDSDDTTSSEVRRSWKECVKFDINDQSSSALSRRAEKILLNAKRRLNAMEGNLNRARTSILEWQDSCSVSIDNTSPATCSKSSADQNDPLVPHGIFSSKTKHWELESEPACEKLVKCGRDYKNHQSESSQTLDVSLRLPEKWESFLSEHNEYSDENFDSKSCSKISVIKTPSSGSPPKSSQISDNSQSNLNQTFNNRISEDNLNHLGETRVLTRSASSLQMREIQDQMQGLKGRLSFLRDRTKNDIVRRRSLQSMKIPTPFTFAEKHCFEDKGHFISEQLNVNSEISRSHSTNDSDSSMDARKSNPKLPDSHPEIDSNKELSMGTTSDLKLSNITLNSEEENKSYEPFNKDDADDSEDDASESDASVYYDTTVSHEDREDAFDYEHFFLHSAMGTIGEQRRGSFSSEESVATTRGYPNLTQDNYSSVDESNTHLRSPSTDTLSTVASFQTAVEGMDIEDNLEENKLDSYAVRSNQINPSKNYSYLGNREMTRKPSIVYLQSTGTKSRFSISSYMPKRRLIEARFMINDISGEPSTSYQSEVNLTPRVKSSKTENKRAAAVNHSSLDPNSMEQLSNDDQTLVKRLINSLGECVLSLQETGKTYDARVWRRRLDAARRVLEGFEGAV
ncbi:hypothetical protein Golomagni_03710 [Golovinomyces magnicellulatus]|nr:hypothetical protein Golomagni_03710 [Golovinomyces magnicellulatus]